MPTVQISHNPSLSSPAVGQSVSSAQRSDSSLFDNIVLNPTDVSPSSTDTSDVASSRYMIPFRPQDSIDKSSTRYMLPNNLSIPETVNFDQGPPVIANQHPMITRSKKGIVWPKLPFAGSVTTTSPLHSVTDALTDPNWKKAMADEFAALQKNHTWSLVPSASNTNIMGSNWIFKIKYKSNGQNDRHKAKLVAQGFTQTPF